MAHPVPARVAAARPDATRSLPAQVPGALEADMGRNQVFAKNLVSGVPGARRLEAFHHTTKR